MDSMLSVRSKCLPNLNMCLTNRMFLYDRANISYLEMPYMLTECDGME